MSKTRPLHLDEISKKCKISKWKVSKILNLIKRAMQPLSKRINVLENGQMRYYQVERRGIGVLNTSFGKFWEYSFSIDDQWKKYSVIVKAGIDKESLNPVFKNKKIIVLRIDSGCETGQIFNDLTCDCGEQLSLAMKTIADVEEGMIICIPTQDGRGMGLTFKLATLWIQDVLGLNTVESATLLAPGGVIDVRTYSGAICILKFFEINEQCGINLATNNPKKALIFKENGYSISEYVPMVIEPNQHTHRHLVAKQEFLGHINLVKEGGKIENG